MAGSNNTGIHNHTHALHGGDSGGGVVSALFTDTSSAYAAIRALREIGIPTGSISMISRDQESTPQADVAGVPGVSHEEVVEEGITYRASPELPNDEDLPTTEAAMTGADMPDLSGGDEASDLEADRIGLSRDTDMVRRNEAQTNADEDIYSDFKDEPGGVNPDSPAAERARSDVQAPSEGRSNSGGACRSRGRGWGLCGAAGRARRARHTGRGAIPCCGAARSSPGEHRCGRRSRRHHRRPLRHRRA